MELLNQPFTGQLGDRLIEMLDSEKYHTLNLAVAFAKNSGVLRIKDSLERFRERGGKVNAYIGVDLGGTSYEALTALLIYTDSLNVIHSENGQTFHVKIYQFIGDDDGVIVIGSHNLTGGGLWTNFESSVLIPVKMSGANPSQIPTRMAEYVGELIKLKESFMAIDSQSDVDRLLKSGYILKEVFERVKRAKAAKLREAGERLFGNGVPTKLPNLTGSQEQSVGSGSSAAPNPISVPMSEDGPTIWLETRKMTGGSRNILDLSMKSLVSLGDPKGTSFDLGDPKFMRGGVEFFGVDPADTGRIKDITLNFEGIDYAGNAILFPVGNNPNGTWRLQIKGISASGQKITDAFRGKGETHYLVKKVITFTMVKDDYYFLSVFPETSLKDFESASRILARNGVTNSAKRLGLL